MTKQIKANENESIYEEYKKRYTFIDREHAPPALGGFVIEEEERTSVVVELHQRNWAIYYEEDERLIFYKFGLYNFGKLVESIAGGLMSKWQPPQERQTGLWLKDWVVKQTIRSICKRVHIRWKHLLKEVSPDVLAVQRAVYAATNGGGCDNNILFIPELYDRKFIVRDLINHRAAIAALLNIHDLTYSLARRLKRTNKYSWDLNSNQVLDYMENWRGLFSPTGEPDKSLNRTLMNMPGGVPVWYMPYLQCVHLERPMKNRSELLVMLCHVKNNSSRHRNFTNSDVFFHTREHEIRKSLHRLENYTGLELSFRRFYSIRFLVGFLTDYPYAHRGNLVGLTDKAIRWHRDEQYHLVEEKIAELGGDTPAHKPPIPLPSDPRIRFLGSVADICQEGKEMEHCIASYVDRAVSGDCYIFHLDYGNESATAKVQNTGRVSQVEGPTHSQNKATRWGKRVLSQWGANIPQTVQLPQDIKLPNHDEFTPEWDDEWESFIPDPPEHFPN